MAAGAATRARTGSGVRMRARFAYAVRAARANWNGRNFNTQLTHRWVSCGPPTRESHGQFKYRALCCRSLVYALRRRRDVAVKGCGYTRSREISSPEINQSANGPARCALVAGAQTDLGSQALACWVKELRDGRYCGNACRASDQPFKRASLLWVRTASSSVRSGSSRSNSSNFAGRRAGLK